MPAESPFRIALVIVIVLTMSVTVYHRWQARAPGERLSHKQEGCLFAIALRLAGLALWLATLGYLLFPASVGWAAMPLPSWCRWSGVASGGISSLLLYWTLASLGKNLTDTVVTRKNAHLVTHGPYRWVRHPFYFTAGLLMLSVTIFTANWLIGVTSLLVLVMLGVRTPKEEALLIDRFGDEYRQYMAGTGRFFPRIRR